MSQYEVFYAFLALGLILIFAYKLVALIRQPRDSGWRPIDFSDESREIARAASGQKVSWA